jgi:hypothetical protein
MSMKNSSDTIGNRTRDVPVCSAVPQPTAPPRAQGIRITQKKEWISEKTWDEIILRKRIKGKINVSKPRQQKAVLQAEYSIADEEVKEWAKGLQKMGRQSYKEGRRCCTN